MIMTLPYVRTKSEMTMIWMFAGLAGVTALVLVMVGWQNADAVGRLIAGLMDRIRTILPATGLGGL
jgi:hypothetical protein